MNQQASSLLPISTGAVILRILAGGCFVTPFLAAFWDWEAVLPSLLLVPLGVLLLLAANRVAFRRIRRYCRKYGIEDQIRSDSWDFALSRQIYLSYPRAEMLNYIAQLNPEAADAVFSAVQFWDREDN